MGRAKREKSEKVEKVELAEVHHPAGYVSAGSVVNKNGSFQ